MSEMKFEMAKEKCRIWMENTDLDSRLRKELEGYNQILLKDPRSQEALDEIYERFYKELEFGTGGLRGIIGAGTNRMNVHTVARATQGLANYVKEYYLVKKNFFKKEKRASVAISYDSRNQSEEFAKVAARVLIANHIDVYLYSELMPTPALSFAVRYYHCVAGVMITASHNPAKYNGYKVYNDKGCQLNLEQADQVLAEIEKLDIFADVKIASQEKGITYIPQETIDAYFAAVKKQSTGFTDCKNLEVVYTPLNGTGNGPVRRILREIGVEKVHIVEEQELPDGNFTTCPYPNPEKKEALHLGLALCEKLGSPDLLIATDPDCDRVGVAVKHKGEYCLLTGNEVGVLLLDFLCQVKKLPKRPLAIQTIVSSRMTEAVGRHYGLEIRRVLTGFKFIGEQIGLLEEEGEEERYIFGFEESYGYLAGSYVRDKDAVNASMLICEMTAFYKSVGNTLLDHLEELYQIYGYYKDDLMDFTFEGAAGMEKMKAIMEGFRTCPPKTLLGKELVKTVDYQNQETGLPKSNVLEYDLEDGSGFMVRPSGTEPKLKIYLSAKGATASEATEMVEGLRRELSEYTKKYQ